MPYIGQQPTNVAFLTDTFSGNGSTTTFTMSVAPASTSSVLVAVSGVLQDPSTYSVSGTTLTFSGAPPSGTGNISVRYLGIPASGVTTTAYRTVTEFTATASQTTFTPPSYTVGFINVYRNGVLLGSADYTATNGTTVVLATGATAGDLVTVESFLVSSVLNAIPDSPASVGTSNLVDGSVTTAKIADDAVDLTTKVTGVLPEANGGTGTTTGYYGFKNRIINGAMMIDQRNAGASVTPADLDYTLDRWQARQNVASKYSLQQSSVAPNGFINSLLATSLSSYSVVGTDIFYVRQNIEGLNCTDLGFGTVNAQTVTLSFWVRSSLTGTFGGSLANSAINRSYVFSYTINSANTWEQKTITIAGDTSGTWLTTNGIGLRAIFSFGIGSTVSTGTVNAWQAGAFYAPTGATSVVGTSGATFYITGVQLEKGSTATSFDYRPYGTELALCQRYCFVIRGSSEFSNSFSRYLGVGNGTNQFIFMPQYPVMMRTPPTLITSNFTSGNLDLYNYSSNSGLTFSSVSLGEGDVIHGQVTLFTTSGVSSGQNCSWRWNGNPNASIGFNAEL